MTRETVTVIGAGLAGLAVALRLNKLGYRVIVLEKQSTYGGKLGQFEWQGYRWDKGPSLFTLPQQVDELFELYDKSPKNYFRYLKMEESCHYYFTDGSDFLFLSNPVKRNEKLIAHFGENGQKAISYIEESKRTYDRIGDLFIDHPKYTWKNLLDKKLVKQYPQFLTKKLMGSLHQYNRSKLKDKRLVQVFDRYGTYNGSNPYQMSGLYSMIPHLEINEGTYFPENGMRSIADSLYKLTKEEEIPVWFNQANIQVKAKEKGFDIISNENRWHSDKVVCAIDYLTFYRDVFKQPSKVEKYKKRERSSSAVVFYWAVEKVIPELKLHNIFFGENYRVEFAQIFGSKEIPDSPTIYVHISSVVNSNDAPENGQNWFVMINTPAGVTPTPKQSYLLKDLIIRVIKQKFNVDIAPYIIHEKTWDAAGIEKDTGAYLGALYGASSNDKMAALKRHGNQSKLYKQLYFCGGTVHPGGGIPLVLKSAKIVEELIKRNS